MPDERRNQLTTAGEAVAFVKGGLATFTLCSRSSGKHFTYKVMAGKGDADGLHFVKVMVGTGDDYAFLGTIFGDGRYYRGRRSRFEESAACNLAFKWFWHQVQRGNLPTSVEFWHEGRCARCGRPLTNPESIASGFGPVCRKEAA